MESRMNAVVVARVLTMGFAMLVWGCSGGSGSGSPDVQEQPDISSRQDLLPLDTDPNDADPLEDSEPGLDVADVTPDEQDPPGDVVDVQPEHVDPPTDVMDPDVDLPPMLVEPIHRYGPSEIVRIEADEPGREIRTEFFYDEAGRLIGMNELDSTVDEGWITGSEYYYDMETGELERERETVRVLEDSGDDFEWVELGVRRRTFEYGPGAKVLSYEDVEQWTSPGGEPQEWTETGTFVYDENGDLVQLIRDDGEGIYTTDYVWNDGLVMSFVESGGFSMVFRYDQNGFISNVVWSEDGTPYDMVVTCHADGRMASVQGLFTVAWTMDGQIPVQAIVCQKNDPEDVDCSRTDTIDFTTAGSSYTVDIYPIPDDRFMNIINWFQSCRVWQ
jgi:hypothetical protein